MSNLTFRGYAKSKGFDPLKAPDESNKRLLETQRTLQGMRDVRDQNNRNRQAVQTALDNNFAKEERQRARNQNLLEDFKDIYHKAELQHYETRIKNAQTKETEAKRKYDQFNKLKDLSVSAFRAVTSFEAERGRKILENSQVSANKVYSALQPYGITSSDLDKYSTESMYSGRNLKTIVKAKHPNVPHHVIDKSLSGWHLMAVHIEQFDNYVESGQLKRDINEKIHTNKYKGLTAAEYASNPDDVDGKNYNAALTEIQDEMTKKFIALGYNPRFVLNYMTKNIDAEIGFLRKEHSKTVQDNDQRISAEKDATDFKASIKEFGSIGEAIDRGLDRKQIKQGYGGILKGQVIKDVKSYFNIDTNASQLKWNEFEQTKIRDHNGNYVSSKRWFELQGEGKWYQEKAKYVKTRITVDRQLQAQAVKNAKRDSMLLIQQRAEANLTDGIPTKRDYEEVRNQITMTYNLTDAQKEEAFQGLKDKENREPIADQIARVMINKKLKLPGGLRAAELTLYSPAIQKEFFSQSNEAQGLDIADVDEAFNTMQSDIAGIVKENQVNPNLRSSAVKDMISRGRTDFFLRFRAELGKQEHSNSSVALAAFKQDYLTEIKSATGFYSHNNRKGEDFAFDQLSEDVAISERLAQISSQVELNPNSLKDPNFLTQKEKEGIKRFIEYGGSMPMTLVRLDTDIPDKDPYQISEEILGVKLERIGLSQIPVLSKNNRRLVTHKTSLAKTIRYIDLAGKLLDDDIGANEFILDSTISKEIYNANPDNPHSVFRTSSGLDASMSIPIESLSLAELNNTFNNNSILEAGAYGLESDDIYKAIADDVVVPEDVFDVNTQRNIYKNKMFSLSDSFTLDGMIEKIPGLGHYHAQPIKKSRGTRKKATNLLDTKVGKFLDKLSDINEENPLSRDLFRPLPTNKEVLETGSNLFRYLNQLRIANQKELPTREGRGRIIQEAKQSIWQMDLAEKGFNVYQFSPDITSTLTNMMNGQ